MNSIEQIFKDYLVIEQPIHYGRQLVFRFKNSYGLSVIEETIGVGPRFNIAIIKFDIADNDYSLDYSTGIADDNIFSNREEVILHLLTLVKKL